jgi:hypothetical protein
MNLVSQQAASAVKPINANEIHIPRKINSKSKRKRRSQREAKPAVPAEVLVANEQIAALSLRVAELSRRLASQAAKPTEDVDARREIAELKARVLAAEERAAAAEAFVSALRSEMAKDTQSNKAIETKIDNVSSTLKETQTTINKVAAQATQSESAIKRIGTFRFSGDFRLRADAIWRRAIADPGPGQAALPHMQNVRARYRLRFNFDIDVNPWVSFHGQLATGPENNSLTLDQEFGGTVARHPFFINEAWADFHPTRGFNVKGGRVQEVFSDNSRFLFDDDVRFNGLNETLKAARRRCFTRDFSSITRSPRMRRSSSGRIFSSTATRTRFNSPQLLRACP